MKRTAFSILVVGLFIAGPAWSQAVEVKSQDTRTLERPGGDSGTFSEYWVRTNGNAITISLETDKLASGGAMRIALHQCNAFNAATPPIDACAVLNVIDTDGDGQGDSNVLTGTYPQRGVHWFVVPGWVRIEVTTQPSTSEHPVIIVPIAYF